MGFALFGVAYLTASLIPAIEPRLPTTKGLTLVGSTPPATTALGVAFADFDSDGQVDLFVANNSAPNTVSLDRGDGTFRQPTAASSDSLRINVVHAGSHPHGCGRAFPDHRRRRRGSPRRPATR